MSATDNQNPLFKLAASFVHHTHRNIFLTGRAGTGKTTFLRQIQQHSDKNTVTIAPTGVAAINARGVTAHSFLQLPLGLYIPGSLPGFSSQNLMTDRHSLIKNIRFGKDKRKLLQELELLIIDEVSMLRADMLDAIDQILRHFRRRPSKAFGGVQVLFIGDLFQLPPVVSQEDWSLLSPHYASPFFLDAHVLREDPPLTIELQHIYRQSDPRFIHILNNIRNNQATAADLQALHERFRPQLQPTEGTIVLTTHNYKADAINRRELERLPGRLHRFEASIQGEFNEKAYPAERVLELKEGAQIMFIKNDKGEVRRYFNGKIGTVERISDEGITVHFPDGSESLLLEQESWRNIRYRYDEGSDGIQEEELGTYTQYPIRLAWAITIHKSQGLTFEQAVVDAGASFAPGQVYVALSRLTSLGGLVLHSRIDARCIHTDERVLAFSRQSYDPEHLRQVLEEEQKAFMGARLMRAFGFERLMQQFQEHHEGYDHRRLPAQEEAVAWSRSVLDQLAPLESTAQKFRQQLEGILPQAPADGYHFLHLRTAAAAPWFLKSLEALSQGLQAHYQDFEPRKNTKKYRKELEHLGLLLRKKEQQIRQAATLAEGLAAGHDLERLLSQPAEALTPLKLGGPDSPSARKEKGPDTRSISLGMFLEGKAIAEIATTRGMAVSTISGHLAECVGNGSLPLERLVPTGRKQQILEAMRKTGSRELSPLKAELGPGFEYYEIRAVINHLQQSGKSTAV